MVTKKVRQVKVKKAKTQRVRFSEKAIAKLRPPEDGRAHVYDTKETGLGVRLEKGQPPKFFWFRKVRSVPKFILIGEHPVTSVGTAVAFAQEQNGRLAEWARHNYEGVNPFQKAEAEVETLGELLERYVERRVRPFAAHPEQAEKYRRWQFNKYLSHWKHRPLANVTKKEVLALHSTLGTRYGKTTANRVVEFIRTLFEWASSVEIWGGTNPAKLSKEQKFREEERSRFLEPEELLRFFAALDKMRRIHPDAHDAIALLIHTGQRKSTVLAMRWDEIAPNYSTWSIPRTKAKNRKPFVFELSAEAAAVLRARKRNRADAVWVFPSVVAESAHREEIKKPWQELLKAAGIWGDRKDPDRVVLHSLRHSFISYGIMSGKSLEQVGGAVGHMSTESTRRYSHLAQSVQRQTVAATAARMKEMMREAAKKLPAARLPKLLTMKASA